MIYKGPRTAIILVPSPPPSFDARDALPSDIRMLPWPPKLQDAEQFFESKVRPVLANNAGATHGHTGAQSGGLRLDSREAILKGGANGPAVVPGDPQKSLLIQAVSQTHTSLKMPPGDKLEESEDGRPRQVGRQRRSLVWFGRTCCGHGRWLPDHAAATCLLVVSSRSRNPAPPRARLAAWQRNAIDAFVWPGSMRRNSSPRPRIDAHADSPRHIRPHRTSAYPAGDRRILWPNQSPQAFAKLIDRLLGFPATTGNGGAATGWTLCAMPIPPATPQDYPIFYRQYLYRDYVIDSFNHDKPYDQFRARADRRRRSLSRRRRRPRSGNTPLATRLPGARRATLQRQSTAVHAYDDR